ncbi:hypothetical protein CAEBREN_15227 [Caenorhabditis brenneri]|uniref:Uncharacterized protein n=1 Tax=Caenorhabditis brenneri TaxID=135651 RepID=G0MCD1_CAEBE|nr:hypothetical protein CAEBREN_15227 [Caenorhabditis brenneri]
MEVNYDPKKSDRYQHQHLELVEKTVKLLEIINAKLARFEKITGKSLVLPFTSIEYRAELMRETTENVERWRKILEYHRQRLIKFERRYGLTNPDETWAGLVNRWINRVKNLKNTVGSKLKWRNSDEKKVSEQKSHPETVEQIMELYEIFDTKLARLENITGKTPLRRPTLTNFRAELMGYNPEDVEITHRFLEDCKRRLTGMEKECGLTNPDKTWAGLVNRWINRVIQIKNTVGSRLTNLSR